MYFLEVGQHAEAEHVGDALQEQVTGPAVIDQGPGERPLAECRYRESLVVLALENHALVEVPRLQAGHLQPARGHPGLAGQLEQLLPAQAGTAKLGRQGLGERLADAEAPSGNADEIHSVTFRVDADAAFVAASGLSPTCALAWRPSSPGHAAP
jgi:hypothetical protein